MLSVNARFVQDDACFPAMYGGVQALCSNSAKRPAHMFIAGIGLSDGSSRQTRFQLRVH
jgi:hypothetical protein